MKRCHDVTRRKNLTQSYDENTYKFKVKTVELYKIIDVLGLAYAQIVETKFLELAMSLLDFSPRIPLGTFSIWLLTKGVAS